MCELPKYLKNWNFSVKKQPIMPWPLLPKKKQSHVVHVQSHFEARIEGRGAILAVVMKRNMAKQWYGDCPPSFL